MTPRNAVDFLQSKEKYFGRTIPEENAPLAQETHEITFLKSLISFFDKKTATLDDREISEMLRQAIVDTPLEDHSVYQSSSLTDTSNRTVPFFLSLGSRQIEVRCLTSNWDAFRRHLVWRERN